MSAIVVACFIALAATIGFINDFLSFATIVLIGGAVYAGPVFIAFRTDATLVISVLQGRS